MAKGKKLPILAWFKKSEPSLKVVETVGRTALYTYLDETLTSPRLRRMLHDALKRAQEGEGARRA